MMIHYIYDGTFTGLLTAIANALESLEPQPTIVREGYFLPDLFAEPCPVETDPKIARLLYQDLAHIFTKPVLQDLYYCFLSEEPGIETVILEFIRKAQGRRGNFDQNYADETVRMIRSASDHVAYEVHRMHGFIRFRKMNDGIFYAPIEPDHNVLALLAPHFAARFADQSWFIHDLRRGRGLYYDLTQCVLVQGVEAKPEAISRGAQGLAPGLYEADEFQYQELWDEYFQSVAIAERMNPRAQRQHMPKRYWKHLVEKVN